jgi:xanthine/uracil permease
VTLPGRAGLPLVSFFARDVVLPFSLDGGVVFSFLVCYLALSVNDLGSMESLREFFKETDMGKRINRGIVATGLANGLAGLLGVVGPVNYSLSPGVILSTGCATRFALVPTGLILVGLSFTPFLVALLGYVPPVVIGAVLAYILCFQIVAGLSVMGGSSGDRGTEAGIVVAFPLLAGTVVSFLPSQALAGLPATLHPLVGNGFVVGVITAFVLEHGIFRHSKKGE